MGAEVEEAETVFDCPPGTEYVWSVFWELSGTRQTGMGINPIPFAEIAAWEKLNGARLQPWEVTAIRRVDAVFLKVQNARNAKPKAADTPATE